EPSVDDRWARRLLDGVLALRRGPGSAGRQGSGRREDRQGEGGEALTAGLGMQPETRYARSGDVHIAYQVGGLGPMDLVLVPGGISHLDLLWESRDSARFFERLAAFSRLILFDKRGTGLSDRVVESQLPTLEQRMDDVRAVMDAAGSSRAALLGI